MRQLLLAVALSRAVALLDSPGLRGTTQSVVDEPAAQSVVDEPAGQYSVRSKGRTLDFGYQDFFVRGLSGGLLHELLQEVPRRGLRRRLLPGRERRLRGHEEELLLCYDKWWKCVLDDGDRSAVPRRRRGSRRPKGAVQLLTAPAPPATSSRERRHL